MDWKLFSDEKPEQGRKILVQRRNGGHYIDPVFSVVGEEDYAWFLITLFEPPPPSTIQLNWHRYPGYVTCRAQLYFVWKNEGIQTLRATGGVDWSGVTWIAEIE